MNYTAHNTFDNIVTASKPAKSTRNVLSNYGIRNRQAKNEESFDDLYNIGYDDITRMDDNEDIQRYISVNRIH